MDLPFLPLLGLALGLSMDCAAVAAAKGLATPRLTWKKALSMAAMFGAFQAIMPLLGYFLGATLGPVLGRWDHWIAFVLLAGIGIKMLYEAFEGENEGEEKGDSFRFGVLLGLSLATSIDSFAAGVVLPLVEAPLLVSVLMIGGTTIVLTLAGAWAGRRFGKLLGRRLDVLGGIILLALAAKTLFEHL